MTLPGGICYFVVLSSNSAFFKLQDILPECFLYREQSPRLEALVCLRENACHVGHNCMETLVQRARALFEELLPTVSVLVLYFRKLDGGYRAGLFWRDMREPRVITMNPYAWERVKARGKIFQFLPSESFFLGKSDVEEAPAEKTL